NERRDAQTKHELQWLDGLPAELPALVKRPDAETAMDQHGGVKHDHHGKELPEQEVVAQAPGHRLHRDIAERVVEEMAGQVGKQDQPANHANLPDADAAKERSDFSEV